MGVLGVAGSFYLFLGNYQSLLAAWAALNRMSSVRMLTYLFPAFHALGVLSGTALLVAGYGLLTRRQWACLLAVSGTALGLVSSWMPIVWPLMIGEPVPYVGLFLPYLLLWLVLTAYVRAAGLRALVLTLLSGIAMVLATMSGTAALNKLLGGQGTIYIATQTVNWAAAAAWGVFTVAALYRKEWALPVGLMAGALAVMAGAPLAYFDSVATGELSMFTMGPVLSLLLLVTLLATGSRLWMEEPRAASPSRSA